MLPQKILKKGNFRAFWTMVKANFVLPMQLIGPSPKMLHFVRTFSVYGCLKPKDFLLYGRGSNS